MGHEEEYFDRIVDAVAQTEIMKAPKSYLQTFGTTRVNYFIVTEPIFAEFASGPEETVIREGIVTSQRPAVVTSTYMARLEGFNREAQEYFDSVAREYGPNTPGLLYSYRNEPGVTNIVEGHVNEVGQRISQRLHQEGNYLSAVIKGMDDLWDLSLLKFIFEYTRASITGNINDLYSHGLLTPDPLLGAPNAAVHAINNLFHEVRKGNADPSTLKRELDRWGLFEHYQDKFFSLFHRRKR